MQEGQAAVNNSCPQCGWFSEEWEDWLPWDGNLPAEVRGDIQITPARTTATRQCRYFAHGHCRRGNECTFLHTQAEVMHLPIARRRQVCRHFLRGHCQRGDSCAFIHSNQEPPQAER